MSVEISVSNLHNINHCDNIIEKLKKINIDYRTINTKSIVDNHIEYGCIVTIGSNYNSKKNINDIWNKINSDKIYNCSHLKIEGIFSGCILNYINANFCN